MRIADFDWSFCRISFKRKHKKRLSRFSLSNLFSNEASESTPAGSQSARNRQLPEDISYGHTQSSTGANLNVQKEGGPLDWYVEGPGRRVGYDDLTAIDWIFEYTKERQRKRLLYSNGQGLVGYARKLLDAGNVWLVLIATGVAVGIIAAFIDVASDWLADLRVGFCKNGEGGGKFYLNRSFCCWGHDGRFFLSHARAWTIELMNLADLSECLDWIPWRKALGVNSKGGGYTVEYIFYVLYSVTTPVSLFSKILLTPRG